jgi:hypothetical protein
MKKFIRMIDWRKFFKLMYVGFAILCILYLISLANGHNTFPTGVWVIPIVSGLWLLLLSVAAVSDYLRYLRKEIE